MNFCMKRHFYTRHIKNVHLNSDMSITVFFENPDPNETCSEIDRMVDEATDIALHSNIPDRYPRGDPNNLERILAVINAPSNEHFVILKREILQILELMITFFE